MEKMTCFWHKFTSELTTHEKVGRMFAPKIHRPHMTRGWGLCVAGFVEPIGQLAARLPDLLDQPLVVVCPVVDLGGRQHRVSDSVLQ